MKHYNGTALLNLEASEKFDLAPYLPSKALVKAVRLARVLGRPLLVKGEPGCGKSKLAEAVAAELHGDDFRKYYFEWNVKSTSKAQDGLYFIDHLQRLSDANIQSNKPGDLKVELHKNTDGSYKPEGQYVYLKELGLAFQETLDPELKNPPVILIDEIDKADIDFPNDLLLELDRMEFGIPEAKDQHNEKVVIRANRDLKPLVIITSNDEKPLPPAFLRRCLFHYISFSEIKLKEIVESKFPDLKKRNGLVDSAVTAFEKWREKIRVTGTSTKNISTSELLDWMKLIYEEKYTEMIDADKLPPFHEALLKDVESIQMFAAKVK